MPFLLFLQTGWLRDSINLVYALLASLGFLYLTCWYFVKMTINVKKKNNWVKRRNENIMSEGKIYFVFAPWFCVTKQLYEVIIVNIIWSVYGNIVARKWSLLTNKIYCLVDHTTYWYNERTYSFCLETNCLLYQLYDFLTFNLFTNRVTELYKVDLPWHVNCINLWNLSCVHKHYVLLRVVYKMCFVKLWHVFRVDVMICSLLLSLLIN